MPRATPRDKYFETPRPAAQAEGRTCDVPGCNRPGTHRAPKGRNDLHDYYWFCLDHVRDYNRAWNYFEGLDEAAMEAVIRNDTTWNRPTWPFGRMPGRWAGMGAPHITDGFAGFGTSEGEAESDLGRRWHRQATAEERDALSVMGLEPPPELEKIKSQYKKLVKRHHPDVNGGDPAAEDRLKEINRAYAVLLSSVASKAAV